MSASYFTEPEKAAASLNLRVINTLGDLYIITGPEENISSGQSVVFGLDTSDRIIAFEAINLQTDSPDSTYEFFEDGSITHGITIEPTSLNRFNASPVDIVEMSNGATVNVAGAVLYTSKIYGTSGQGNKTEITGGSRAFQFLLDANRTYYIEVTNNHTQTAKYQFEFLISEYL